ncbi:MAG: vWA domain-containing protein [Dysgonomonas sp.]
MKKRCFLTVLIMLLTIVSLPIKSVISPHSDINNPYYVTETPKIQVAILLDTSSSMDGLIEQAKSRLWNVVNTLTTLKFNGVAPQIEIAIYEYGNDNIRTNDYIRQVTPLTTDLDFISQKLFALTTYGGDEYCGAVIDKAVKMLDWGKNKADMKLVYIAGNEPFTQGRISYKESIDKALGKDIYVNTIHCGNRETGISGMWRDGAIRGKGKFFNIDHNARVRHYDTPYDDRISLCNEKLNATYISYGSTGRIRQENQIMQDKNAKSISKSNLTERAVSKSATIYDNSAWDLVDKVKRDKNALSVIKESELPKELQNKSKDEVQKLIAKKESERTSIQKEINELAKKRQAYIDEQAKNDNTGDDLGKAINESILALANTKGYSINK